jgi:HSP20 family protein
MTMTMFFEPFQELDRIAGSVLRRASAALMPVDLYREGDHFLLTADLPGIDPASVDVSVDSQTLTLRAERTIRAGEGVEWLARERPDASFVRQFTLGDGIDAEHISANYDNGVLSVVIPMAEQAKPRKIRIASGGSAQRSVESADSRTAEQQAQPVQGTASA